METSMAYFASLALRSFGLAAIASMATLVFRRADQRHAIWTAVVLLLLLLPAGDAVSSQFPALPPLGAPKVEYVSTARVPEARRLNSVAVNPETFAPSPANSYTPLSAKRLALPTYLLLAAALLFRLCIGFLRVRQLRSYSVQVSSPLFEQLAIGEDHRTPRLLESKHVAVPVTTGFRNPVIVLPEDWRTWDEWDLRAVLIHELTHVRRGDWAISLFASFAKSILWFNPAAWIAERCISRFAEEACDEASLRAVEDAARYASLLLRFASAQNGRRLFVPHVAMARTKIAARVERVLNLKHAGAGRMSRIGWVAMGVVAIPVLYGFTMLEAKPQPPETSLAIKATVPWAPMGLMPISFSPLQAPLAERPEPAQQPPTSNVVPNTLPQTENPLQFRQQYRYTPGFALGFLQTYQVGRLFGTEQIRSTTDAFSPNDVYCPDASCTVTVTNVQNRTVTIRDDYPESRAVFTYSCQNCSRALGVRTNSSLHFGGPDEVAALPHVAFRLSEDADSLTIECRALKCTTNTQKGTTYSVDVVTGPLMERVERHELVSGESVSVTAYGSTTITFSRP